MTHPVSSISLQCFNHEWKHLYHDLCFIFETDSFNLIATPLGAHEIQADIYPEFLRPEPGSLAAQQIEEAVEKLSANSLDRESTSFFCFPGGIRETRFLYGEIEQDRALRLFDQPENIHVFKDIDNFSSEDLRALLFPNIDLSIQDFVLPDSGTTTESESGFIISGLVPDSHDPEFYPRLASIAACELINSEASQDAVSESAASDMVLFFETLAGLVDDETDPEDLSFDLHMGERSRTPMIVMSRAFREEPDDPSPTVRIEAILG